MPASSPDDVYTAAGGARLSEFLDSLNVDQLWLRGHHIVWLTGQRNAPLALGRAHYTHCSSFVAATATRLNIYLLRPPFHDEILLANAQDHWLRGFRRYRGQTAAAAGWMRVGRSGEPGVIVHAQQLADRGQLVVASYAERPAHDGQGGRFSGRPGHIAILRPSQDAAQRGHGEPRVCTAGHINASTVEISAAFETHQGAWPSAVDFYAHATVLEHDLHHPHPG